MRLRVSALVSSFCVSPPENQDVGVCVCMCVYQVQRKAETWESAENETSIKSTVTYNNMCEVIVAVKCFFLVFTSSGLSASSKKGQTTKARHLE